MNFSVTTYIISGIMVGIEHMQDEEGHAVTMDLFFLRLIFEW